MTTNGSPAIKIEGLSKTFEAQQVLNGIDLQVRKGESVVVLGRSGTGKSVLLKLVVGLLKPDSGRIEVDGEEITSLPDQKLNEVRKKIGFLFQFAALYDSLKVEENVAFPLIRHTKLSPADRMEKVKQLLSAVGMEEAMKKMPDEISGGMKKRVGLARALALDPSILLLDEPTAGLDPIASAEINDLICRLQEEKNVSSIVVTHDMHTVQTVSDRVAMLHEGSILLAGTLDDLKRSEVPLISEFIKQSF